MKDLLSRRLMSCDGSHDGGKNWLRCIFGNLCGGSASNVLRKWGLRPIYTMTGCIAQRRIDNSPYDVLSQQSQTGVKLLIIQQLYSSAQRNRCEGDTIRG